MRLCKEIIAAIPKDRLPIVCTLSKSAYCGWSYAWLTINKDLSFEYKTERCGVINVRRYTFDKMYDALLLSFECDLRDFDITAMFHMRKSSVRKALTRYSYCQEVAPIALGLALSSNKMDVYLSGNLVELLSWLKRESIKYSVDIKMVDVRNALEN